MASPRRGSGTLLFRISAAAAVLIATSGFSRHEPEGGSASPLAEREGRRISLSSAELAQLQLPRPPRGQLGSVLNISAPMKYGDHVWDEEGVPDGPILVRVDLAAQTISIFRGGHEIGTAVVLYGGDDKPTPIGDFHIIGKLKDHRSSLYDAAMPYTLRLTEDGIAIHGSDVQEGAATNGCVGVPRAFAALLFDEVERGDKVIVV